MAKKRKSKTGTKIYWTLLLTYTLALSVAAVFALRMVWTYAEEYEAARPNHVIDKYVDDLNKNLWVDGISEAIAAMPHPAQTDEECAACVKEMLKDGIVAVRQGSTDGGNSITYNLRCSNGNVFGKVTLVEDMSKVDDLQFKTLIPWKISSTEFDFNALYTTVEITAPKIYKVYINTMELGEEYIVEDDIHYDVLDAYYNDFPGLPTKARYRFDQAIGTLEPVVKDDDGNIVVIDETQDDSQFIVPCSDEMLVRLSDFSVKFADRYLKFVSGVGDPMLTYEALMPYIVQGTAFDNNLHNMMDGLSYGHTSSYRMDSAVLNGALDLGGGNYMCDVSANYTVFYPGRGEESGTSNMHIICVDTGDTIKAVSQELY